MTRLSVATVALTVTSAMAGCRPEASDSDPSEGRATTGYEDWQPVYREVRPATESDQEELRERIHELNASSYTAALDYLGAEIASTPEHVRVRFGDGGSGGFDLHLDPARAVTEDPRPYVLCFASEDSCVEVGLDASSRDASHLFNNMVDSAVFMLAEIVRVQLELADGLAVEGATYATIDSPLGLLECIVGGGTDEARAGLEGQPADVTPDPLVREDPPPLSPICLDQHGLAVVLPSLLTPIAPYSSFEVGVDAGIEDHPAPMQYGETPTPTRTPTRTERPEPDEPQNVLVAAAIILPGESLGSAMAAGKLYLESVPGESVLPGAVTSAAGLEDRVALLKVPVGGQITKENFSIPSLADLQAVGVTPALYDEVRRVAARNGYGKSPGAAPPRREMLVLAYRFVHRCEAVAGGTTTWNRAAIDDHTDDSPSYDQALQLNEYLETNWCPRVVG